MKIVIDQDGLAALQDNDLAIGLVRATSPDVGSALAFSLAATDIVGNPVVELADTFRCFATAGVFGDLATVVPGAWSQSVDRAAIADTGFAFTFDGQAVTGSTSNAIPGALTFHNSSENDQLTMGMAETFTVNGSPAEGPSLLNAVAVNMTWLLESDWSAAYLFTISSSTAVGTIIPPELYQAVSDAGGESVEISTGLPVDLSDEQLSVTYDPDTGLFSPTDFLNDWKRTLRWLSKFC